VAFPMLHRPYAVYDLERSRATINIRSESDSVHAWSIQSIRPGARPYQTITGQLSSRNGSHALV